MNGLATGRMPAAFIGHGSPMNALAGNRFTAAWRQFGASVNPRAVLVVSAHWFIEGTAVTAMPQPRTIHDFGGFPQELFEVQYPAPGDPALAAGIAEMLAPDVVTDADSWGLDHGTWSILVHMFPDANIPVLQLSIDRRKSFAEHFELGRRLAPLRERGVLVLGSGNVVHNLRRIEWRNPDAEADWNQRFDNETKRIMTSTPRDILTLHEHPDYALAVPTPEHFIPLLYLAGMADAAGETPEVLLEGPSMGSLSMTSFQLG